MKILFVIPRNKSLFGDKVNMTGHPRVGIAYLVSFLNKHGIKISIYDEGKSMPPFFTMIGQIEVLSDHVHLTSAVPPRILMKKFKIIFQRGD